MTRAKVFKLIEDEIDYTEYWDIRRIDKAKDAADVRLDKDMDVETWLAKIQVKLQRALNAAYDSTDKTAALDVVRQIAGLAVNCMLYNETPERDLSKPIIVK